MKEELFKLSKESGYSFEDISRIANRFSKLGLNIEKIPKAVDCAILLSEEYNFHPLKACKTLTEITEEFAV